MVKSRQVEPLPCSRRLPSDRCVRGLLPLLSRLVCCPPISLTRPANTAMSCIAIHKVVQCPKHKALYLAACMPIASMSTTSKANCLCDQALAAFAAGQCPLAHAGTALSLSPCRRRFSSSVRGCGQSMSPPRAMIARAGGRAHLQLCAKQGCGPRHSCAPAATSRSTEAQCAFDASCRSHPEYAFKGFAHWQWKPVSAPLGRHLGYCASCATQRPVFDPAPFTAAKWCSGVPPRLKDLAGLPGLCATQVSEDGEF